MFKGEYLNLRSRENVGIFVEIIRDKWSFSRLIGTTMTSLAENQIANFFF